MDVADSLNPYRLILRQRFNNMLKEKKLWTYCQVIKRANASSKDASRSSNVCS